MNNSNHYKDIMTTKYIDADNTSTENATPSGQAKNLTFEEYLRGVFEINNGIENDPDNLVRIHAPELLKLAIQQEKLDYKEAVQLVFEEKLIPFKDGNQWCFLLGRNIQEGICGFGDTILDAAVAFYKDYMNTRIHIGELKISMTQQELPGVDLEKELEKYCRSYYNCNYPDQIQSGKCSEVMPHIVEAARRFYELGRNGRKEESK